MLTKNNQKAELSIAYVIAVAAKVKFACEITRNDYDSVDATLTSNGKVDVNSVLESPEIKLQLKATENLEEFDTENYKFSLSIKNYNDLRANTMTPRLLVVLSLPNEENQWLAHSMDELILRKCAYWVNLKGKPATTNTDNITVYIPKSNVLSPDIIKTLMIKASKRELL